MRFTMISAALLTLALSTPARAVDDTPNPLRSEEARLKAMHAEQFARAARREILDPNQLQYDTRYIALDIEFFPGTSSLSGSATLRAEVTDGPISTLVFDFDAALTATSATGSGISVSQTGDYLTVTLDRPYLNGEIVEVTVQYNGVPDASAGYFGFETADGETLIWSLSEPYGARTWFPVKDTPADKADSASIRFTVPSNLIAVSNGTLDNVVDLGTTKRYEWTEHHPIAPYLISIAAHPYVEQSSTLNTLAGPLPLVTWSYGSSAGSALTALGTTGNIMLAFEGYFGPYPYMDEKYGQVQFNWGGGMEHQTATSLCCWTSPGLIAHEMGHQWFGDQVTCETFRDVWVNEGFATYSEALWRESSEGFAGYMDEMNAAKYFGPGTIRVPEADLFDFSRVFNSGLSYNKASWVLHMLRGMMGDTDFFNFLPAYAYDPAVSYGTATTADVQRVAEAVSGLDLQAFFDEWIDQEWYPTYAMSWSSAPAGGGFDVTVQLDQIQSHYIYTMPVRLRIVTTTGDVDVVLQSSQASDTAIFQVNNQPLDVLVDPDDWILKGIEPSVPDPSFDRGILLVNGVDISTYGAEITTALDDSTFTGHRDFEFWSLFPGQAYPPGLPTPRGEGAIPADILDDYSTVVWAGNDWNGDLSSWIDAAILDYLHQGGNVVLLGRRGSSFLTQTRLSYLGAEFATTSEQTVSGATTSFTGLVPMTAIGQQSWTSPLALTTTQPETQILMTDTANSSWALGAWRHPTGGGTLRTGGGHFVHLAGRPYRWDHASLRANMEFILTQLILEPNVPTAVGGSPSARQFTGITDATPNPFNPRVRIDYTLRQAGPVRIDIYDIRGRLVRTLVRTTRPAGPGDVVWDGNDASGAAVASGVYTVHLEAGARTDHQKITLVR